MSHFVQLLLLLPFIVLTVKAVGAVGVRLGQPAVFGELMAGVILGPSLLAVLGWPTFSDPQLHRSIRDFAELGVILLMFVAGLETNLEQLRRVGGAAFSGAIGGVLLPFFAGWGLAEYFGFPRVEAIFIGTILTATSVSISVQTLMELGRLRSREGMTILGAAVIDDVLGVVILSLVVAFAGDRAAAEASVSGLAILVVLLKMAAFFVVALFLGRYFENVTRWASGIHEHQTLLTFALVVLLIYSWAAEALGGVAAITGAYIAGLLLSQTSYRHIIEEKLKVFAYALFVPIFLASIGMEADIAAVRSDLLFAVLISLVAVATKIVGSGAGTLLARYRPMESLRVGMGMVSRGEVALILSTIGLDQGVIGIDVFSVMVLMTLVTTLVTPVLLRISFRHQAADAA